LAALWQTCAICNSCHYPIRNKSVGICIALTTYNKFTTRLPVSSDSLIKNFHAIFFSFFVMIQSCQRAAKNLWHICQNVCLITYKKATFLVSALLLKKVKFKFKNPEETESLKNVKGSFHLLITLYNFIPTITYVNLVRQPL
jgi:hypothetical protein